MVDPFADSIASGALLISLVAFTAGEVRASKSRNRTRRLGPEDDIRKSLVDLREVFATISGLGGQRMHYFLDPSLRTTGSHLRDLAAQVADETLRSRITTVADTWDSVVKDAPSSGLRFSAPGTESTASRVQRQTDGNRLERQTQSARMGIEQCQTALERLNEISLS